MENYIKYYLLLIILVASSGMLHAQVDYLAGVNKLPDHPRILMLKGEEENIKKCLASNPVIANIHKQLLNECDVILNKKPLENIKIGKRLLDKSREALRRIFYLSYAWRITQDEKYFKKAEQELLNISSFPDWNPSHFLDVAEMTMAVSIGYDWLYNKLSDSSKLVIKNAIKNKGLAPSLIESKDNWWLKSPTNWNQVCNAGMTYGALAIFEDQPNESKAMINRSISSMQIPMKEYGPDGTYAEGYGYWDYGTSFNVMFLAAINKMFNQYFGLTDLPGFLKTPYYFQNMTGPSGDGFNFSDSGLKSGLQPSLFWFSKILNDPSLLIDQNSFMISSKPREYNQNRLLPALILWSDHVNSNALNTPKDLMWAGKGKTPVALMRTSWTDTNAIFVAIKGGTPSTNHAHMDIGSFIMEADGVRWAMDFGSENYNNIETKGVDLWNMKQYSERWQIFRYNSKAHNILTINDSLQRVDGKADLKSFSKDALFMNAVFDLKDVYRDEVVKANRGIAIIDKSYVVIRDEIEPKNNETTIKWNMLTPADVKIISETKAELTKNGKKLLLQVQEPTNVSLKTWSTQSSKEYEASNKGTVFIGFEIKSSTKTSIPLTVLLIPEKGETKTIKKVLPLIQWPK